MEASSACRASSLPQARRCKEAPADQSLQVTDISEIMRCEGCVTFIISPIASLPLGVCAGCNGWPCVRAVWDELCANSCNSHFP